MNVPADPGPAMVTCPVFVERGLARRGLLARQRPTPHEAVVPTDNPVPVQAQAQRAVLGEVWAGTT
jgi:hypothetical protein